MSKTVPSHFIVELFEYAMLDCTEWRLQIANKKLAEIQGTKM